jgi:hypothetical protein
LPKVNEGSNIRGNPSEILLAKNGYKEAHGSKPGMVSTEKTGRTELPSVEQKYSKDLEKSNVK